MCNVYYSFDSAVIVTRRDSGRIRGFRIFRACKGVVLLLRRRRSVVCAIFALLLHVVCGRNYSPSLHYCSCVHDATDSDN